MLTDTQQDYTVEREFATKLFGAVVLNTLRQRSLLKNGDVPQVWLTICLPDRIVYILDMEHLAGVPLEKWDDDRLHRQLRAASGGRRVVVTAEDGIAIQIGRAPDARRQLPPLPKLPDIVPLDLNTRPRAPYSVGIGVGHEGAIWAPLEALGHIMVSGATGSGKSYFLRSLVYQLINLSKNQPVLLYLADRAGNVFTPLGAYKVPQLAAPVAKTARDVIEVLERAVGEMRRRERLFDAQTEHFPDKLAEYNAIPHIEKLPRVVVVVDEVTVLVAETGGHTRARSRSAGDGDVHRALLTLAAQGRKYGFTLVVAGQDFKASTFNTALTHQLSTRVAFKAGSANESRVVLGVDGAERLRGAGRGLLRQGGRLVEFQGFLAEKADLVARCAAIGTPPNDRPTLADWETRLVLYALEQLDGAFTIGKLFDAGFGTKHEISKLAKRWEVEGLLVNERRGDDRVSKRWVTPKLAALARENAHRAG